MNELEDLVKDYQAEAINLVLCQTKAAYARSEECDALNRVNAAQKKIEVFMREMKSSAPNGTDWRDAR